MPNIFTILVNSNTNNFEDQQNIYCILVNTNTNNFEGQQNN